MTAITERTIPGPLNLDALNACFPRPDDPRAAAWARARYTRAARAETTTAGIVTRLQTALSGAETPAERANLQAVIEHLQSLRTHTQEREDARAELELAAPAMTRTTNRALLAHARALHDPSADPAAVEEARAAATDAQTVAEALRKVAEMLAD